MYKTLSIENKLEAIFFFAAVRIFDGNLPTVEQFCKDRDISRRTLYNLYHTAIKSLEEMLVARTPGPSAQKVEPIKIDSRIISVRNELSLPGNISATQKEKIILLADELKKKEKLSLSKFCECTGLEERTLRVWRRAYNGAASSLEDKRFNKNRTYSKKTKKNNGFKKLFAGAQVLMDTTFIQLMGFKFSIIAAMDAFNKRVLSVKIFYKENSDAVIKTMKTALIKTGVLSFVLDNGRPYVSQKVKNFLEDSCILRILCAPYHPQSKGAIERWFRTMKSWLRHPFKLIVKNILSLLCNMAACRHNKNLLLSQNPVTPVEKSFEELEKRSKSSLRKRDIICDIQNSYFLNNKKPATAALKQFPIAVLNEGSKRLNEIRKMEGFNSSKNTGPYFIGILKNILPQYNVKILEERKKKEKVLLAQKLKEEQKQRENQQRLFYINHPEHSLIEYMESFINLKKANLPSDMIPALILKSWNRLLLRFDVAYKSIPELLESYIINRTSFNSNDIAECRHIIKTLVSFTSIKEKNLRQLIKNAKAEMIFDDAACKHELINRSWHSEKSAF